MRGFVYDKGSPSGMRMAEDVPKPSSGTLKPGQVLVSMRAASINPIDYKKPAIPVISWGLGGKPTAQDFSGVVAEASPSSRFKAGDEVFGMANGCMAETLVADDLAIALKPKSLTFEEAAALPTAHLTSLQAMREAGGLAHGGSVCVVGASGGCGSAGLALARALVGAEGTVAAICGTDSVAAVEALGLASPGLVLDYRKPEGITGAASPLRSLSKPLDLVYDTVTSPESGDGLAGMPYDKALAPFLAPGSGRTVAINGSAWRWVRALLGAQGSGNYRLILERRSSEQLKEIADWIDEGLVRKPTIDSVHSFTAAGCEEAYQRVKSRRSKGKVVVKVSG